MVFTREDFRKVINPEDAEALYERNLEAIRLARELADKEGVVVKETVEAGESSDNK